MNRKLFEKAYLKATPAQRALIDELRNSGLYTNMEACFAALGWFCPLAAEIWKNRPKNSLPYKQSDALVFLLRAILGYPCDGKQKVELSRSSEVYEPVVASFIEGVKAGHIKVETDWDDEKLRSHVVRTINNNLRRDPRLNGHGEG